MAQKRTLYTARNLIQATAGGWLMGAVLGLSEALFHAGTSGAPDALAPVYAVALYGLIGLPFGVVGGVLFSVVEKWWDPGERGESRALVAGAIVALWPMAAFAGRYLLNKIIYLEQGVPLPGMLGLAGALLVVSLLLWTVGVALLEGPLARLRTGPGSLGAWGVLLAATGVWAVVGAPPDPRGAFDIDRPIAPALEDKPNILVIAVDTLRADALGTYGAEGDPTPVLDGLARRGVVFEQAHTQASWTRSSFASLWTSRLPSGHNADTKSSRLSDDAELVSEVLQQGGVVTGNLVNNINVTASFGFDQGWDVFLYEAPEYVLGATESVFGLTFYKVVHKLYEKVVTTKEVGRFYQPAEVVFADAKRFIEANADSRWMLVTHLMEPHDPYFRHPYLEGEGTAQFDGQGFGRAEHEHPDPARAEELARLYKHEVMHMDRRIGAFMKWLEARGELDRTVIVVTSDHGEEFHEHGGFWHGQTLYDEQTHVPLIVTLPGGELAGTRVPWQVRSIDVAPTLTSLMGLSPSGQWEGADLLGELRELSVARASLDEAIAQLEARLADDDGGEGDTDADAEAEADDAAEPVEDDLAAVAEQLEQARAARAKLTLSGLEGCAAYLDDRNRTVVAEQDFEGTVISAIRDDGAKRIHASAGNDRGLPEHQLFDVVEDPGETNDLEGGNATICGASTAVAMPRLDEALDVILKASQAAGVEGSSVEMDAAEKARLCALGYMSGPDCE